MSKFCTVINCMDGRVQYPVNDYMKAKYGYEFVDVITKPGPDKILSDANDEIMLNDINRMIGISVERHGSKVIAVCGHYDCAGNPVDKEEHYVHVRNSVEYVKARFPDCKVIGLWISKEWKVYEI